MGRIQKRGKPQYLKPEDVENGDMVTVLERPIIQPAEESKYEKERTILTILLRRTKRTCRWGLNTTSNDACVEVFGEEDSQWIGQTIKIDKRLERVSGKEKYVLYAIPQQPSRQSELNVHA